jgi:hypothetical protein
VSDRLDFILRMRISRTPAIVGLVFLAALIISIMLFLFLGNKRDSQVLYFPSDSARHGLVAERRFVPRYGSLEKDVAALAEEILLGPSHVHSLRLFPRGAQVLATMVNGRTLYLDLSADVLAADDDVPLKGQDALEALKKTIVFNFPRFRDVVFLIDGQHPRFPEKKKI